MKVLTITLFIILLCQIVYAQDVTTHTVACITKADLDAINLVIAKRDMETLELMLDDQICAVIDPGFPVLIMDVSWSGNQKIRVFTDSGSVVVWVPAGGVDRGKK